LNLFAYLQRSSSLKKEITVKGIIFDRDFFYSYHPCGTTEQLVKIILGMALFIYAS